MTKSVFVIMKHDAKKAGLHYDLRFRMPDSTMWASFAVPKGVPTAPAKKVLAIRTADHTKKGALLTGYIKDGYGTGELRVWDLGKCDIIQYSEDRIILDLDGKKAKGKYYLISITKARDAKQKSFLLFKGKPADKIYENSGILSKENYPDSMGIGMSSRLPPAETSEVESTDQDEDKIKSKKLSWDKTSRTVGKDRYCFM